LARFQLTRRIARSLGDSGASCHFSYHPYLAVSVFVSNWSPLPELVQTERESVGLISVRSVQAACPSCHSSQQCQSIDGLQPRNFAYWMNVTFVVHQLLRVWMLYFLWWRSDTSTQVD